MAESASPKILIDTEQMAKDTAINPADLNTSMIQQASLFAHYSALFSRAQRQYDTFKQIAEITDAKLAKSVRDQMAEEGEKITEKAIEQKIARSAAHVQGQKNVNICREQMELAKQTLEALKQKRDMLVQLGVQAREELKGELRIKEVSAQEEARQQTRSRALNKIADAQAA